MADFFGSQEGTTILIWDPMGLYNTFKDEERYLPQSDTHAEFESVCKRLCSVGNTMFIIEEAESYLRQGLFLGTYAFTLAQRGRNWGNGMVAITRRIQDLSKSYFQICQHGFFFRCHPMIREYFKPFLEPEAIRLLFTLPKWHCLYYNMETHEYEVFWLDLGAGPQIKGAESGKIKTQTPS